MSNAAVETVQRAKAQLRAQMRKARRLISQPARIAASLALCEQVLAAGLVHTGARVGAYLASGSELSLVPLFDIIMARGARVYLPQVRGDTLAPQLHFARYSGPDCLTAGAHDLLEPNVSAEQIDPSQLHLILAPLLAVDALGFRLGQGGGYYDRLICGLRAAGRAPLIAGVAYDCQRVSALPVAEFDAPLDAVFSPSGMYQFPAWRQRGAAH